MVFTYADIFTGMMNCAALPDKNIPGFGKLTAEALYAQALTV